MTPPSEYRITFPDRAQLRDTAWFELLVIFKCLAATYIGILKTRVADCEPL
jgi:hypothetical protein